MPTFFDFIPNGLHLVTATGLIELVPRNNVDCFTIQVLHCVPVLRRLGAKVLLRTDVGFDRPDRTIMIQTV